MHLPQRYLYCQRENQPHLYAAGFSLLELLVAFTILALTLGALYPVLSQGTQSLILSDEYSRAVMIAESKLTMQGTDKTQLSTSISGTENEKYHWSSTLESYSGTESLDTAHLKLYTVSVQVTWTSLGKSHSVELNSLKLLPLQ